MGQDAVRLGHIGTESRNGPKENNNKEEETNNLVALKNHFFNPTVGKIGEPQPVRQGVNFFIIILAIILMIFLFLGFFDNSLNVQMEGLIGVLNDFGDEER